ncbi:protein E6-like isoform X2 [Hibiscus syriacus]|uniref:protein E6-like isoform X2 n=1 Tax=Hibiscus syriacus TaxID=106335 RepID=UPI001922E635|nr:protein E6-like isoform X2 [Hibiscus syriacus]
MASTPKLLSIIFLLSLFSIQIHAREFFSKIPRENNNAQEPTVSVPNKEEPSFTPQTQNGYGLYGPETNTRGTYQPYVTPVKFHPDEPYNMIPESNNNNNKDSYFHSKSADQSTHKENLGEARFTEKGWSTEQNHNNYYNGNNEEDTFTEKGWSAKENKENSKNNNYYNGEKQGMSDTRFLENGKYFHDIRNENNYYPNQFESSRGFSSRNEFNENRYKNMGRYNQNQEELEENEEEFEP